MMKRDPEVTVLAAGILLMTRQSPTFFLLMRHRPSGPFPAGRWDLPKGHCEPGESFLETALRETEEETGIVANEITIDPEFQLELTYPVTYKKTGKQVFRKQVRYFLGYVTSPYKLELTEHASAHWLPWNPPHRIQSQTIDPILAAVEAHLRHEEPARHRASE